jgi:hypothetical protein
MRTTSKSRIKPQNELVFGEPVWLMMLLMTAISWTLAPPLNKPVMKTKKTVSREVRRSKPIKFIKKDGVLVSEAEQTLYRLPVKAGWG